VISPLSQPTDDALVQLKEPVADAAEDQTKSNIEINTETAADSAADSAEVTQ
jgi:hypothetical protein